MPVVMILVSPSFQTVETGFHVLNTEVAIVDAQDRFEQIREGHRSSASLSELNESSIGNHGKHS
jgi:hypothetical protein